MSENGILYFQPWLCGQSSSAASSTTADQSERMKMLGAVLISHTRPRFEKRRERCVKMADFSAATRISLEELILRLYDINAVKFGEFTLKSGMESPIYIDLRVIVSYPDILVRVSEYLWDAAKQGGGKFVSVCGVPYTALPLATCISTSQNLPMLVRRKEAKDYGTKKMIEGHYKKNDVCLVVEDVVTSGSSVLETVESLKQEGIVVKDVVVMLDREQGGRSKLEMQGIKLHSVLTVNQILDVLETAEKVDQETVAKVKKFVADNRFDIMAMSHAAAAAAAASAAAANTANSANGNKRKMEDLALANGSPTDKAAKLGKSELMRYRDRAQLCSHPMSKALFQLMDEKKSNLAFSVDVTKCSEALELIDKVGPHICVVKTHIDILEDYTPDFTKELKRLAEKHHFLIFEDRKFADIGNTVKHQFSGGLYKISTWADLVNAHSVSGDGIIKGLKEACNQNNKGCILIAEMSSSGSLAKGDYTDATVKMAEEHDDFVVGFICQKRLTDNPEFIHMTPGVQLSTGGGDALGQQYLTPEHVIKDNQSDVIIVGRGILNAEDPIGAAKQYQEAGYKAYLSLFS